MSDDTTDVEELAADLCEEMAGQWGNPPEEYCGICTHWTLVPVGLDFWCGDPPGPPRLKKDNEHFLITSVGSCARLTTGEVTASQYHCKKYERKEADDE